MKTPHSVLIVEGDVTLALDLMRIVAGLGLHICGHANGADQAVSMAETEKPDVIIMDALLTGRGDGIDAGREISSHSRIPIIYVTDAEDPALVARIDAVHPAAIIRKPVNVNDLGAAIEEALAAA